MHCGVSCTYLSYYISIVCYIFVNKCGFFIECFACNFNIKQINCIAVFVFFYFAEICFIELLSSFPVQEQYVFKYFLGDLVKKAKSNGNSSSSSSEAGGAKVEKTKDVEFEEAVRDLKISWIGKSVFTYFCVFNL